MYKELKKEMLGIALPIMLQTLILSMINLADVFMIGRVGEVEIASVGLSNQILFLFMLFCIGINSAGAIFVAQYYGRNDKKKIKIILAIAISLSMALASIFTLLAYFIPDRLMRLYTEDVRVIDVAIPYLRIVAISYIFTGLTIVYSTLLRSMGNTKMAMHASIITLFVNITLNYLLIFGKFGFPKLGVAGAAIATTSARFFEIITIVTVSKKKQYDIFLEFNHFKKVTFDHIKEFFVTGLPVMGSHIIWSLGTTILFMIYGRVGTDAVTAMNISGSLERIAFITIVGLGSAVGVIVGQELGRGNFGKAYKLSKDMIRLNGFLAAIVGGVLFFSADFLVSFYNIPLDIKIASEKVIKTLAIALPIKALNFTNMVGILRSGGDTRQLFVIDMVCMWGVGIPMAFMGYKLGMPIFIVFALALSEEVSKLFASMHRFISKKWLRTI